MIKKLFLTIIIGGISGGIIVAVISVWAIMLRIPDFGGFENIKVAESTKIYDRTGKIILYDIHKDIKRTTVPFNQIPRNLKNATIAVEDTNFYGHQGISFFSITRAFITNLRSGEIKQGGSTITQQLIKNTFLTPERTIVRKIKEVVLALKVEKRYSKDELLNFYLNAISYGSSNYGVEAASQAFFGKSVKDITLAEAAYLAALPKAPTYYSPFGEHRDELETRKNFVLERMKNLNFISESEFQKTKNEKVIFLTAEEEGIKAPHFVMFIRGQLIKKYGEELVEKGGLKVTATLDWELQNKTEEMTKEYVKEIEKKFNAYNAGLVGIDPKTGQILLMIGSKDWFGKSLPQGCSPGIDCRFEPQLNVTTYAKGRQPGSSFKPFVYATAFEKGYTPNTVVFDLKTEFNTSCNPDGSPKQGVNRDECYQPENYDNVFRGPVTLRNGLAQSINVPSVKVLYLAGLKESLKTAKNMGITTLTDPQRYGLTLVLGGGETKLLEMTEAYSVFANNGMKNQISGILEVRDRNNKILEKFEKREQKAIDANIAKMITDVLSDNAARAPAFGESSYLNFPGKEVAVKTGTTNNYRDAWVIGYTPNFALGLWVGNNNNESMEKKVAGFIAAPLWHNVFEEVFKKMPAENFEKPDYNFPPLKPVLNGEWRGSRVYQDKIATQIHSILYWVNKNNPRGPIPEEPFNDPQFSHWEYPVREWVKNQGIKEEKEEDIIKETEDNGKPEYQPKIKILEPAPDTLFKASDTIMLKIQNESVFPLKQLDFFFKDSYLGSLKTADAEKSADDKKNYLFSFRLENFSELEPTEKIQIKIYDVKGNSAIFEHTLKLMVD